ncbi:hypothetical protein NHJ13734_007259 [Beauveria thailandica]
MTSVLPAKQCCALVEQSVSWFITNDLLLTVTMAAIYALFYRFSARHCLSCRITFNADSRRGLLGEQHIKLREQSRTYIHKVCAMESGEMFGVEAPRYIVGNINFLSAPSHVFRPDVKLVDFDQCFPTSSPPQKMLGTPYEFLAPEVAAGLEPSPASDVWALGCCILRLRAGVGPFSSPFDVGSPADVVNFVTYTLGGDVPREWQEIMWDDKGMPTKDARKGRPLVEWSGRRESLRDIVYNIWDEPSSRVIDTGSSRVLERNFSFEQRNKPFHSGWSKMVWNPQAIKVDGASLGGYDDNWPLVLASLPKIPDHEAALLLDLLTAIFVYDPKKRPTAEELLEHPWFHLDRLEQ